MRPAQGYVQRFAALIDPDGQGARLLFQQVPEGKTAKNRIHLDEMSRWIVLLDPEGNEFCLQ